MVAYVLEDAIVVNGQGWPGQAMLYPYCQGLLVSQKMLGPCRAVLFSLKSAGFKALC